MTCLVRSRYYTTGEEQKSGRMRGSAVWVNPAQQRSPFGITSGSISETGKPDTRLEAVVSSSTGSPIHPHLPGTPEKGVTMVVWVLVALTGT